ncbi:MAG: hypothetical protein ACKOEY_02165, partial [Phenylobacterium sp.]
LSLRERGEARWRIGQIIGRSEKAVGRRLARLDQSLRPWDIADELTLLRMSRAGATFGQIAVALGRSINSCQQKWMVLMGTAPVKAEKAFGAPEECIEAPEAVDSHASRCDRHLIAILRAEPRGFAAWSEKRVGVRGIAPCHPLRWPLKDAA